MYGKFSKSGPKKSPLAPSHGFMASLCHNVGSEYYLRICHVGGVWEHVSFEGDFAIMEQNQLERNM